MLIDLLTHFWVDLHETRVWWQIAVVAVCMLASYFVSHFLHKKFPAEANSSEVDAIASKLFVNMLYPIVLLVFLCLAKVILLKWHHVYLLSLLIPIFGALAVIRFGSFLSRRIFAHGREVGHGHLLLEKMFSIGVWLVAILYYSGFLPYITEVMDEYTISIGRTKLSVAEISQALVSIVITVLLALWASAALDKRLMKVSTLHTSSRMVLSRIGRSLLVLLAILVSLNLAGIDVTVLSVFGGALGIGLGLGLQKITSNYVAGFIILLDRSLSIDDMITVDKYSGKVSEINTRYTVLKGLDGVESVIPNEMLVSSPVQNLSLTDKEVLMTTDLVVAYNTDVEALLPKLVEKASSVERVSKITLPSAYLANFGANGLELRVAFWISDPENGKMSVVSEVNREIWRLLKEQKIEIPYPQREIRVIGETELKSRM